MIYCTKCGKQNADAAKFCTGCGITLNAVVADLPKNKSKRNWVIIGAIIFIGAVTGIYFLFFNKTSYDSTENNSKYVSSAIADKLKMKVNKWNEALNNKDVDEVADLFADRIVYYRSSMSKGNAATILNNFFLSNSGFYQHITSEIGFEKLSDNLINCNFQKSVTNKGKSTDFPSYLKFSEQNGEWKIVEEGDKITDYNIDKKK